MSLEKWSYKKKKASNQMASEIKSIGLPLFDSSMAFAEPNLGFG